MKARWQLLIACVLCLTLGWVGSGKILFPSSQERVVSQQEASDAVFQVVVSRGSQPDTAHYFILKNRPK